MLKYIVAGGDGLCLIFKKICKFKKPFYGINSGNYGFLMNRYNLDLKKKY